MTIEERFKALRVIVRKYTDGRITKERFEERMNELRSTAPTAPE